jgi:hypothetical protein
VSLTDKQKFIAILSPIVESIGLYDIEIARKLVAKNQNPPTRDGSFTDREWTKARDAVDALVTLRRNLLRLGDG